MAATAKVKINKGSKALGQFANLPSAFKSAPKGASSRETMLHKIQGLKASPVRQLQEAASLITQLNRYSLKNDKRTELVQAIMTQVYSVIAKYYRQYQTRVLSLPESKERKEIILACIDIADQAAITYKHLFKDIYTPRMLGYRRHREKCIETSVRILELIRLSQRFRALRHQKLPVSQWQDVNRVFFSMMVHGDVEVEASLFGNAGTWSRKSANTQQSSKSTAQKIYFSIQLFGLLDAASWSTRLFHSPDAYLEHLSDAFVIHTDTGKELEPGWLITNIDHNGPPLFQREQHMSRPMILIEYSNLYNRLVQDYEELARMKFIGQYDADKLSRPLLDLESIERFPLLETMLFGLRPRERKQKRHAAFGHENLKLHFGYKDTFALLMGLASEEMRRIAKTRAFSDSMATVSPGLGENGMSNKNSKWEIVNFSTGGILVLTRESVYTNPIQIGQLVAFNPNEEVKRPLLGYLSRINRPNEQQVEVAIVRLSNYAEAAIIKDEKLKAGEHGLGVLVFKNMEGKWCLIASHDYELVPGTPFKLLRENNTQTPARLGHVMLTKQEFIVFELSAPGMG